MDASVGIAQILDCPASVCPMPMSRLSMEALDVRTEADVKLFTRSVAMEVTGIEQEDLVADFGAGP